MLRKTKKSKYTRGYERVSISATSRYYQTNLKCCSSCKWYFKTDDDIEEFCQCPSVMKYDVIKDGNRVYCHHWKYN